MPLSCLRRPLALAVALYMLALTGLKARGFFRVAAPAEARRWAWAPSTEVEGAVLSGFAPKRQGDRIWLRADRVGGSPCPPVKLMVYLSRAAMAEGLRPGQRARFFGRLRPPLRPGPGREFDERDFLENRRAALVLHARGLEILQPRVPPFWLPWAWAEAAHRSLHGYLARRFPSETAAMLEGFLLGYKGPLPPRLNRRIQDAGAMHLLVPSGAKVAFVLAFALWLAAELGLRERWRLLAAAAAGGFYVLMAGGEPPYTRAYLAFLSVRACRLAGRETAPFSGLLLSAALTLALCPRALFEAGFQMTYLAALGLLIAMPRWRPPGRWNPRLRSLAAVFLINLVVQLMLWPVFAATFRRGSLAGLLANMLLVPASALVMAAGFCAWAASSLPWGFPEAALAAGARRLVAGFAAACAFFASLPGAAVDLSPMSAAKTASFYLAALGLLLLPQWRLSLRALAASALVWLLARLPAYF